MSANPHIFWDCIYIILIFNLIDVGERKEDTDLSSGNRNFSIPPPMDIEDPPPWNLIMVRPTTNVTSAT
jgi:hypothetical protein